MAQETVTVELTQEEIELLRRVAIFIDGFEDFHGGTKNDVRNIWIKSRDAQYDQTGE